MLVALSLDALEEFAASDISPWHGVSTVISRAEIQSDTEILRETSIADRQIEDEPCPYELVREALRQGAGTTVEVVGVVLPEGYRCTIGLHFPLDPRSDYAWVEKRPVDLPVEEVFAECARCAHVIRNGLTANQAARVTVRITWSQTVFET